MFRCLAKVDSLIFYIFPLLSPPLPFFLCSLQMLFIPCHHTLLPFKLVFPLTRPVAFLSFPVKYNNVFGLAFLPHFSSLRSTAIVPHFQAFSCLFFFSPFDSSVATLQQTLWYNSIKSIDKLHRVLGVPTGWLLLIYPIRSVASLDQMCSRIYCTSQAGKKTSSI